MRASFARDFQHIENGRVRNSQTLSQKPLWSLHSRTDWYVEGTWNVRAFKESAASVIHQAAPFGDAEASVELPVVALSGNRSHPGE